MDGYSATGKEKMAMIPARVMMMEMTIESLGRSINIFENMLS
jgi:hypothetical protein